MFLPFGLAWVVLAAAGPPGAEMSETARFARSSNTFGFDLYTPLARKPGNLVVSPASISTALTMTWVGARGDTAAQMKRVLHFEDTPQATLHASAGVSAQLRAPGQPIVFRIANRLFGESSYRIEPAFLDATREAFGAALEGVSFKGAAEGARVHINQWVEAQTEKRIQTLLPAESVNGLTRLVLVNAIYFLGDWLSPFEKDSTSPEPFYVSPAVHKDVPTMHELG